MSHTTVAGARFAVQTVRDDQKSQPSSSVQTDMKAVGNLAVAPLMIDMEGGPKDVRSIQTDMVSSSEDPSYENDMPLSPEDDGWRFQITPEITRRLSLLPLRSTGPTLSTLPAELQLEIFSYLDKIDSCCLGLAAPNLYVVYRAVHGTKMPLNTRRIGPNKLESAWEVVGKQECKQCGIYRCELYQHIKSWMPKDLEYCAMKQNFGLAARDGSKVTCYRGKPSKPRRCGRHPQRTTTIHQDDVNFNLEVMH